MTTAHDNRPPATSAAVVASAVSSVKAAKLVKAKAPVALAVPVSD